MYYANTKENPTRLKLYINILSVIMHLFIVAGFSPYRYGLGISGQLRDCPGRSGIILLMPLIAA